MKRLALAIFIICVTIAVACAGEKSPVKPTSQDKCPVCGMFVAKYPDFLAEIIFKDGSYAVFDGVKDMFKYYFNLAKYNPTKDLPEIDSIYVTSYYDLVFIDGFTAFYVEGGNVYGPMGKELIPFDKETDATAFMRDHLGKKVLRFNDISIHLVKSMD